MCIMFLKATTWFSKTVVGIKKLKDFASDRWSTFEYNFGWSDWVGYIDGWIPRFAFFVPIIGYLILFSDQIGGSLNFNTLAGSVVDFGLTGQERLRYVYFGLFFLGISNLFYRQKRPYNFKFGTDRINYSRTALESFTYQDFFSLHSKNRKEPHTIEGKYYEAEWDNFMMCSVDHADGRTGHPVSWEDGKSKYGSLLRSILSEEFFRGNSQRKFWLVLCIFLSSLGYVLLLIPSGDLFIKVICSTFY